MSDTVRTIRIVVDSRPAEMGADRAKRALNGLGRESERLDRTLNLLKRAFIGLGASMIIREMARAADTAKLLTAQLLNVEGSMIRVREAQRGLLDLSIRSGTSLEANTELYSKLARALQDTERDSTKLLRVTETVSKALVLSGADAGTAAAVTRQLGQAFASGAIRGDEFVSVMEGAPELMRVLGRSLGVPIGRLRDMAAEGELTSQKMFEAFSNPKYFEALYADFDRMPMSFGRAVENIKTAAITVFGEFDRGGQFSDSLLSFAKFGAADIQSLGVAANDLGVEIRAIFGGLWDVFDPFVDAGFLSFAKLDTRVETFVAELRGILNLLDTFNPGRLDTYFNAAGKATRAALTNRTGGGLDAARNVFEQETAGASLLAGDRFFEGYKANKRDAADKSSQQWVTGMLAEEYRRIEDSAKKTAVYDAQSSKEMEKAAKEAANRLKAANDNLTGVSRELELMRAVWDGDVERTRLRHELADIDKVRAGLSKAELATLGPILDKQIAITEQLYKQKLYAEEAADAVRRLDPGALDNPEKDLADVQRKVDRDIAAAGKDFRKNINGAAYDFADVIGDVFGRKAGGFVKALGLGDEKSAFGKQFKAGFEEFNTDFSRKLDSVFGSNSEFTKTLGKLGGAWAVGSQAGAMADGIMDAVGIKSSKIGAQIGGTIGSFGGPLGTIAGSIAGGLIGGMMKKTKWGAADITSVDEFGMRGNSGKAKDAASAAATSFQGGLQSIADALGADLGSFGVTIGQRHGDWRVNTSAGGSLKKKKGAVEFDDDAEGAIKYAIRDAIRDGALLGISEFSQRVLRGNMDLDKALDIAAKYETLLEALAASDNPIRAAAESFAKDFTMLANEMKKAGATAAELANIETYYAKEREKALTAVLQPLKDYQKSLSGEGSGVTALNRFNASKLEYEQAKAGFAAGTVDQGTFTAAGQELFALARDVFGTATGEFQSIRQQLLADTAGALETAAAAFNGGAPERLLAAQEAANTVAAQSYQQQVIANQYLVYLPQIAQALASGGTISGRYVNGVWKAA